MPKISGVEPFKKLRAVRLAPPNTAALAAVPAEELNHHKQNPLTFGKFIAGVYDACGKHKAQGIVRLAVKAHWVEFRGQNRFTFS